MPIEPTGAHERRGDFGAISRRSHYLPVERIHPVIRIAHQLAGALNIARRIIFDHELVLIISGEGELRFDGGVTRPFQPGTLLLIEPFSPHSFASSTESGEHIAVHFDLAPGVPSAQPRVESRTPYRVVLSSGLAIPPAESLPRQSPAASALTQIVALRQNALDPLAALTASHRLTGVLLSLLTPMAMPSGANPARRRDEDRVARVIRYIHAHLDQTIEMDRLEAEAGIARSRLSCVFRQGTGFGPLEYVTRARIERARELLADPRLSVKQVSARVGFDDAYHFSKVFRRIDGLSPSQYRAAVLATSETSE